MSDKIRILKHMINYTFACAINAIRTLIVAGLLLSSVSADGSCLRDDETSGVMVRGTVTFSGALPDPAVIQLPTAVQQVQGVESVQIRNPTVQSGSRGLAGVAVYLTPVRKCRSFQKDELQPPILRISEFDIYPRLILCQMGSRLEIEGHENAFDSVDVTQNDLVVDSFTMPDRGESERLRMEKPGLYIIRSTTRPWLQSWVVVAQHPYMTITDKEGKYELTGVIPGQYSVGVYYPPLGATWQDRGRRDLLFEGGICKEVKIRVPETNIIYDPVLRSEDFKLSGPALFPSSFTNR